MAETFEPMPTSVPFVDENRMINPEWARWLEQRATSTQTNIGGIISGVTEAKSLASAAQGTANGAIAGVANLAGQTLAFSVTYAPVAGAYGSVQAPGSVTTNSVTVTPVGGTGPYTYAWTISGANIGITSPTAATTTFYSVGDLAIDEFRDQAATCTVTDSLAATAQVVVPATMYGEPGDILLP